MAITASIMDAMVATTLSNSATRRSAALLALTVGGLLCLTGAARLFSVWQAEPARIGLETLRRGDARDETPALLRDIADSLAEAGRMGPFIVPWATSDRGGSLQALIRLRAGDPLAATVLEAALHAAPGDPSGWVWLARLRLKDGKPVEAGQALRVALLAGQVVPGAMLPRLRLGLDLYSVLDADTQKLVQRQVRLVWVLHPKEILPLFSVQAYLPALAAALAAVTPSDEQKFRPLNRLDRSP